MRRALTVLAALCAAASLVSAAPAGADVSGPDESTASAYGPIRSGSTIPGQLQDSSDVDYIAFDVIAAGQAVHFDVTNEVHGCSDPSGSGCPIWATLMTASDQQVGGDSSSAGTGAMTEYYPTDTIDWTFTQPGRYYLLIESGGYPVPYSVSFTETPPPSSTPARPYFSLSLSSHQRGPAVRVRFRARTPLRTASFRLLLHGRALGTLRLASPPVGARTVLVRLSRRGRTLLAHRHRLSLRLQVTASPAGGPGPPQQVTRTVLLASG